MKHMIRKLATADLCTGCTACASVCPKKCITMEADRDGFRYPVVDEAACVGCQLCESVCPVLKDHKLAHEPKAWAAYAKDTEMRMCSSSGGVFSELARHIFAQGGAIFGASYDEHFRVVHICSDDEQSLARLRGAKYAQSDLAGIFADVKNRLKGGQLVLFSGTPCQVAGLQSFLGRAYENLITVDFVCHGVPSPMVWEKFLADLASETPLRTVNLRSKATGWSRYRYSHALQYTDGTHRLIPNAESLYMKLFTGDYINRPSCEHCPFKGYARQSDLTLGDFWGIWDVVPEMDDDRGTSVVLVQSEKGTCLWNAVADKLVCREVTPEEASRENPSMLYASMPSPRRAEVMERIRENGFRSCADLLTTAPVCAKRTMRSLLRRGLRFLKRCFPF